MCERAGQGKHLLTSAECLARMAQQPQDPGRKGETHRTG